MLFHPRKTSGLADKSGVASTQEERKVENKAMTFNYFLMLVTEILHFRKSILFLKVNSNCLRKFSISSVILLFFFFF
jgi:hypothetical protein